MKQLGVAALLFLAATTMTMTAACGGKQGDGAATPAPANAPAPTDPAPAPVTAPSTSPGTAALADLEALRAQACACSDPACERDVQAGFAAFMERHADTVGSEREAEEAGRIAEAMMVCLDSLTSQEWAGGDGLAPCDAYVAAVERFIACEKVPQQSRDATRQGLDRMKASWGDLDELAPEARRATEDACRTATDALVDGATTMGCAM